MIDPVLAVAGAEIKIGLRNRWVLLAALILLAFALMLAFVGTAPSGTLKVEPLTVTVASLATLSVYLVPLIALLLAFDAVAGEVDRGTLQLVLATRISRSGFLIGKFLGHLVVLALAIVLGYGIAGAIVLAISGGSTGGLVDLARLIGTSVGLGAVFLAIGYVASVSARQTGTAAALSVGIWLAAVVLYDLGLLGALVADAGGTFSKTIFPYMLVANPADAFRLYNIAALDTGAISSGLSGVSDNLPFPAEFGLLSLVFWLIAAMGLATLVFRRLEP
jgi:Cu-processing system permease protein